MENKIKRVFIIVIDSLGIGGAADAADYGDAGTDTLGHISGTVEQFRIRIFKSLDWPIFIR